MTWTLTWRGREFVRSDLTGAHLALIIAQLGRDTWEINPTVGPMTLIANLAAFIAVADQTPLPVVIAELRSASVVELDEAFTEG